MNMNKDTNQQPQDSKKKLPIVSAVLVIAALIVGVLVGNAGLFGSSSSASDPSQTIFTEITTKNVDSVLAGANGVVDFEFVDPGTVDSKAQQMVFEAVGKPYVDQVKFYKVDATNQSLKAVFDKLALDQTETADLIRPRIHWMVVFKDGKITDLKNLTGKYYDQKGYDEYLRTGLNGEAWKAFQDQANAHNQAIASGQNK